ncbi:MAG: aspartate 1-decarboxylase [Armatimonadetes bacterium]|nr:aspartate 1-decarboxylase [Armatimonadota bacterium]
MLRTFCRCKLHRVTITEANLQYAGSLTVDTDLMDAAGLLPYEQVQVVNINNGARLETYVIPGPAGSGVVCLNGAAARLGAAGDLAIVIAYAQVEQSELADFRPTMVYVDGQNKVTRVEQPAVAGAAAAG